MLPQLSDEHKPNEAKLQEEDADADADVGDDGADDADHYVEPEATDSDECVRVIVCVRVIYFSANAPTALVNATSVCIKTTCSMTTPATKANQPKTSVRVWIRGCVVVLDLYALDTLAVV